MPRCTECAMHILNDWEPHQANVKARKKSMKEPRIPQEEKEREKDREPEKVSTKKIPKRNEEKHRESSSRLADRERVTTYVT